MNIKFKKILVNIRKTIYSIMQEMYNIQPLEDLGLESDWENMLYHEKKRYISRPA